MARFVFRSVLSNIRHILAPEFSLHPFKNVWSLLSYIITDFFVKRTLQYLSKRLPIPKILCVNPDIICQNRPGGRSVRGKSQDASDVCAWPVAVPTHIVAVFLFTFDTGASGVKYHPLAHESTISVSCLASLVATRMANLRSHFRPILLLLSFLSGGPC